MSNTLREALQGPLLLLGGEERLEAVLQWLHGHGLTFVVDLGEAGDPCSWGGAEALPKEDVEVVRALQEVSAYCAWFLLCLIIFEFSGKGA